MGATPIWFICPVARRTRHWPEPYPRGHDEIVRTGRTKPLTGRARTNRGPRALGELHEFRCECGHVGWSRHDDMLRFPVRAS